ncbi:ribonuclease Z [Aureitalea marina]|uniref:Ribonuclease Z n=1 Tax=Aureitalea marina TaxID=930804 RepID=A0A2S7KNU2_9FLAO|nr:ribonuclease Z [Aureitalea marina]PQB04304.1 ribonuclease Z [Aureitalea marina]
MKIDQTPKFTVLKDEKGYFPAFAAYLDKVIPIKFGDHHLVIDLLEFTELDLDQLLLLLKVSTYHRSTKHSLVIVSQSVDIDDIPAELVVVPSLQEAADIIEMEEIERDLGF